MSLIDKFKEFARYKTDANGNNIYNSFIENFFSIAYFDAKTKHELNKQKMIIVNNIIGNINRYYKNRSNYDRANPVTVKYSSFNTMVKSYHCYFGRKESKYELANPTIKILHFISQFYNNTTFLNSISGKYPYKMIIKYNNFYTKTFIVNNREHLKETLLKLLFSVREKGFILEVDGMEYIQGETNEALNNRKAAYENQLDQQRELKQEEKRLAEEEIEVDDENFAYYTRFDMVNLKEAELTLIKYSGNIGRKMLKNYKLPNNLSKSVINPNNDDCYCLIWNILINKYIISNKEKYKSVTNKTSLNKLEKFPELKGYFDTYFDQFKCLYDGDVFQWSSESIKKLEEIFEININIYAFIDTSRDEFEIYYRSEFKYSDDFVARILYVPYAVMVPGKGKEDLGKDDLIEQFDTLEDFEFFKQNNGHFCSITESCKFLFKNFGNSSSTEKFVCIHCDKTMCSLNLLLEHRGQCKINVQGGDVERIVKYENNKKDAFISFKNHYTSSKSAFVMYADTETRTDKDGHKLLAYMIYLKSTYNPSLDKFVLKTAETDEEVGDGMCRKFISDLNELRYYIGQNVNKYRELDDEERYNFVRCNPKSKSRCLFCNGKDELVVHHNHNVKKNNIVGWLCHTCNLREQKSNKSFSIFFHNLAYDLLVLINSLSYNEFKINGFNITTKNEYELMAKTKMKYSSLIMKAEYHKNVAGVKSIYLPEIKFTDSYAFVDMSLSKIVDTLKMNITTEINKIIGKTDELLFATYGKETKDDKKEFIKELRENKFKDEEVEKLLKEEETDIREKKEKLKKVFPTTYKYLKDKYGKDTKTVEKLLEDVEDDKKVEFVKQLNEESDELFYMSTEKGLIAYDYCNVENLKSKDNLPIECYKNSLTLDLSDEYIDGITDEKKKLKLIMKRDKDNEELLKDYAKTNYVYGLLKNAVGEDKMCYKVYFEYYLELDICLLADWFEFIRDKLFKSHGLDMVYYRGLPGYSQNCMLKTMNRIDENGELKVHKLHLIEDVNISRLIVKNCRGGYSGIVNKFCEIAAVNGKRFMKYWDVNNLYGYIMSKFKLANKFVGEITKEKFESEYKKCWNNGQGDFTYFLLMDIKVDRDVHDKLVRFPPLISKKKVQFDDISEDSKTLKVLRNSYCSQKLVASLENQKDYLISIDNYKLYSKLGYRFKIKKVLKFEAEYLYDIYIELNSKLRKDCLNELEKALYKLLNNIIYGKSLENPEGYSNLELLSDEKLIARRVGNPLLKSCDVIVDDKLVITDMHTEKMRYSTCIQAGFHILELSKNHMYDLLYNKIFKFCDEKNIFVKLLMHDTDSFLLEFDLKDSIYFDEIDMMKDMKKLDIFDMHKYFDRDLSDTSKKKHVGLLLDEFSDGYEITAFIGLASKSYLVKVQDKRDKDNRIFDNEEDLKDLKVGEEHLIIKGKGVRNSFLTDLYDFEDYKKVLNGELKNDTIKFSNILKKSFSNCIGTVEKIALSAFDDKFYNYKEGNELKSLPYGHYLIDEMKADGK